MATQTWERAVAHGQLLAQSCHAARKEGGQADHSPQVSALGPSVPKGPLAFVPPRNVLC